MQKSVDSKITKVLFPSFQMLLPRQFWYLFPIRDGSMTQHASSIHTVLMRCFTNIDLIFTHTGKLYRQYMDLAYVYMYICSHKCEERQNQKIITSLHICIRLFYHTLVDFYFTYLGIKCRYIKATFLGCNFPNEILKDLES